MSVLLYFFPIFYCYLVTITHKGYRNRLLYLLVIYLALFLCCGYMSGSDWRTYEPMYENIDFNRLFYYYFSEPGYYLYMLPFRFLEIDFWWFFITTKLLCFFIITRTILHYSQESRFTVFMYFIPWYAFYLFIDNPMRNLIAISIVLLSVRYLIERCFWKYLVLILLAMSFHISAILFFPMYFILSRKIPNAVYIAVFLLFNFLFSSREILISLISRFSGVSYIGQKIQDYLIGDSEYAQGRVLSLGMILHLVFFILLLYKKEYIVNRKNGLFIFNAAVVYLLFYRLAVTIEIFTRFQLYFAVFFCIAISWLVYAFTLRSRPVFVTYLLAVALIGTIKLFADYRYIPYTNYLVYSLKGEYPSYDNRSMYNFQHSPYASRGKS